MKHTSACLAVGGGPADDRCTCGASSTPLLIYVAGPYRAKTAWGIEENIHRARAAGVGLAKLGAYPIIPHSNTAHFDGEASDEMWLAGTLALMERCDGVYMLDTWRQSTGAMVEYARAQTIELPVYDPTSHQATIMSVADWLSALPAFWAARA